MKVEHKTISKKKGEMSSFSNSHVFSGDAFLSVA